LPLTTAFENEDDDEYEYETPNPKRRTPNAKSAAS
jgi:hypothetical protein